MKNLTKENSLKNAGLESCKNGMLQHSISREVIFISLQHLIGLNALFACIRYQGLQQGNLIQGL